ncbi:ABC transporter, permease protein 2 (cluster 5, nickel/peptides/opines) [hydrothermal vent metagenome]|uniref:ABC transporter, permease protein 2 (Cluster 5, nickel/peptides/opines) n=1 Tax=hydrothermal vent metagenome TaxID=652676 RepID=A0A3B0UR06_9ZZZZ
MIDFLKRFFGGDLWWSFKSSPIVVTAAIITFVMVFSSAFANIVAPYNIFDLTQFDLMDSLKPPVWMERGEIGFLLGTDDQGRDVLSTILYGSRVSLMVGFFSVISAMVLGIIVGLVAGYSGGWVDAVLMRIADVQLSFPAILIALLVNGIISGLLPGEAQADLAVYVLIIAISLSFWVQYARTVRSSTMVERTKEYVQAAQVIGLPQPLILLRHILPNVMGPVLVIATIQLALAIITEATLSFLGVGVPPTSPSLGTLIRIGNDYLFSGEWWITVFPGLALVILVLAVNILGDWLRDALNPKLR